MMRKTIDNLHLTFVSLPRFGVLSEGNVTPLTLFVFVGKKVFWGGWGAGRQEVLVDRIGSNTRGAIVC